jgi:urease accessory protein
MEGKLPGTMLEGLLSGLGHPVIGPDHLAFIVALGIAAAFIPGGIIAVAAFVAFSTAGVLAHAAELNVPMSEQLVASTVLLAGAALAWRHGVARPAWLALAGAAGLLHGYAFGESIIGAERTALGAYLVGIALVTACITTIVMLVTRRISAPEGAASQPLRLAGVVLGCIGAVLLAGTLVSSPAP